MINSNEKDILMILKRQMDFRRHMIKIEKSMEQIVNWCHDVLGISKYIWRVIEKMKETDRRSRR